MAEPGSEKRDAMKEERRAAKGKWRQRGHNRVRWVTFMVRLTVNQQEI